MESFQGRIQKEILDNLVVIIFNIQSNNSTGRSQHKSIKHENPYLLKIKGLFPGEKRITIVLADLEASIYIMHYAWKVNGWLD